VLSLMQLGLQPWPDLAACYLPRGRFGQRGARPDQAAARPFVQEIPGAPKPAVMWPPFRTTQTFGNASASSKTRLDKPPYRP